MTWTGLLIIFSVLSCSLSQVIETFKSELFLDRRGGSELNAGLYEGTVTGRRRFSETQVPNGRGTIYYFTTDRFNRQNYTGDWVNGTRQGNGTTHFKDGAVYIGEYRNGLENGAGMIAYPNGNRLEADFKGGRVEGHGVFRYGSGDQREGYFSNNNLEGQVIFTRNDGVTVIETWQNGARIEEKDIVVRVGTNIADVLANNNNNNNNSVDNDNNSNSNSNSKNNDSNIDNFNINNIDGRNRAEPARGGSAPRFNAARPAGQQRVAGVNLDLIRQAIRSGDKSAIFATDRRPKADKTNFEEVGEKSRRQQSEFLRKIFQSVNTRR